MSSNQGNDPNRECHQQPREKNTKSLLSPSCPHWAKMGLKILFGICCEINYSTHFEDNMNETTTSVHFPRSYQLKYGFKKKFSNRCSER